MLIRHTDCNSTFARVLVVERTAVCSFNGVALAVMYAKHRSNLFRHKLTPIACPDECDVYTSL
jgi:nucleotidyltransferase/DNA polymerase involved in DNA repair